MSESMFDILSEAGQKVKRLTNELEQARFDQRELARAAYVQGVPKAAIARRLGISRQTVYDYLSDIMLDLDSP